MSSFSARALSALFPVCLHLQLPLVASDANGSEFVAVECTVPDNCKGRTSSQELASAWTYLPSTVEEATRVSALAFIDGLTTGRFGNFELCNHEIPDAHYCRLGPPEMFIDQCLPKACTAAEAMACATPDSFVANAKRLLENINNAPSQGSVEMKKLQAALPTISAMIDRIYSTGYCTTDGPSLASVLKGETGTGANDRGDESGIIGTVCVFVVILLLSLNATVLQRIYEFRDSSDGTDGETRVTSCLGRLCCDFDLAANIKELGRVSGDRGEMAFLNGVRVLATVGVISAHTVATNAKLSSMLVGKAEFIRSLSLPSFQIMVGQVVVIDIFFWLSGFFVAVGILRLTRRAGEDCALRLRVTAYAIVNRYLRLSPAYFLVLPLFIYIGPYLGAGPNWVYVQQSWFAHADSCKEHWWMNIAYLQNVLANAPSKNLFPLNGGCMGLAWYLACDFQFFFISAPPLAFYTFTEKSRRIVNIFFVWLVLGCIITSGWMSVQHDVVGINWTSEAYSRKIYASPWCRVSPFALAVLSGINLHERESAEASPDLAFGLHCIWWLVSLPLVACPIVLPLLMPSGGVEAGAFISAHDETLRTLLFPDTLFPPWPKWLVYFFNALQRTAFGAGLCGLADFMLFPGVRGRVRWQCSLILGAPMWEPLARISYSAFLWHIVLALRRVGLSSRRYSWSYHFIVADVMLVTVESFLAAAVWWVLVERPFSNVVERLVGVLMPRRRPQPLAVLEMGNRRNLGTACSGVTSNVSETVLPGVRACGPAPLWANERA